MTTSNRFYKLSALTKTGLLFAASVSNSLAGDSLPSVPEAAAPGGFNSGDWCKTYKGIGKLYSNPDNPYIQSFSINGRAQYQYGWVDGNAGGTDFSYGSGEWRRTRLGFKADTFNFLQIYGEAEIYSDGQPRGRDRSWGFEHFWQLYGLADLDHFGLDGYKFGYGNREVNMASEWQTSSKRIKTVERSAIANKIWGYNRSFHNPTGAWLEWKGDEVEWRAGVFSTTQDDVLAPWNDGQLYYGRISHDARQWFGGDKSKLTLTAFTQNVDPGDETLAGGLDWASSLSLYWSQGPWELTVEGIAGDNGDLTSTGAAKAANRQGGFYGFVIMPSYWMIEDKMELVARYQYQGSEEDQGIRLNSRYVRRADDRDGLGLANGGRGDKHHSLYLGVNYLLCGHNAKVMAGIEYDDISSAGTDVYDGWSYFLGFRTYF